jgi:mannose/cellobiose epimerase-like protein (N-acyl-D-glucosamine 2-epimerase family)
VLVPRGAPNLVCTIFVANALLDAYEDGREARCLNMAHSAAQYILDELYWVESESAAGFSYPVPGMQLEIHNANFLASALLGRIHKHTGEEKFLEPALTVARHSASKQNDDGSWYYGELPKQRWIDNFHTGYNLGALRDLGQHVGTSEFDLHVHRGFTFYFQHFFTENGAPKYFHDRTYPIDIHSAAQSIITLVELGYLNEASIELAYSVFDWAMDNMWDDRGYFYYRSFSIGKSKTSYMRWSQAWMLLALSTLLEEHYRTPDDSSTNVQLTNKRK